MHILYGVVVQCIWIASGVCVTLPNQRPYSGVSVTTSVGALPSAVPASNLTALLPSPYAVLNSTKSNDTSAWTDTKGWNILGGYVNYAGTNITAGGATAAPDRRDDLAGEMIEPAHSSQPLRRSFGSGVQLRILPLGASIVFGQTSPDGNGFRYGLRNQLVYGGNPVNMVGSVRAGAMADNECEGWPGYVITQVAAKAELSIPFQPNLVLLHVGTNDAVQGIDIQNAAGRLGTLIDRLFAAIPGVTIVASTLLPNGNSATQANVAIYNSQVPGIIKTRQAAGKKITYVDFSSSYWSLTDIGPDGTHPTEGGYMKMAEVWLRTFSNRIYMKPITD